MNKKRISLIIFSIGILTLIASIVFLVVKLNMEPALHDGDFLVSVGEWTIENGKCSQLKCAKETKCMDGNGESMQICENGGVIWNFTEIGKGTLTTNDHINDYDFRWIIEDNKLKIQTDWLYTMNDEFEYTLDQGNNILTIKDGDEEVKFVPLSN